MSTLHKVVAALTIILHNINSEAQHHVSPLAPHVSAHPNAAHTFLNPACAIYSGAFPCAPGDTACETAYKASGCGRRKRNAQFPAHVSPLTPQISAHPNPAHTSLTLPGQSAHPNAAHTFSNPACARFSGAFPCAPGDSACETAYKTSGCGRRKRNVLFPAHVSPSAPHISAHPNPAHTSLTLPGQSAHPNAAHTLSNPACARFSGAFPCALGDTDCQAAYKASGCGRKKRAALNLAFPGQAHPGWAHPGHAHPGQAFPGFAHPGEAYPGPAFPGNAY